ncbi:hypothetical protein QQZ08_000429 [Neonectria magnoliae]|uniref:Uncharacterized protein n=1 Tax=Neonectria magnoliae TaxID=2732573 RepID=A0ABR1IH50_9HYPO
MVDAIGLVSGVLGIVIFIQSLISENPTEGASVWIRAGNGGDDDPDSGGAWTGDIGYECGQNWYANKEPAGYLGEEEEEEYIPKCIWLDGKHGEDIENVSMKFKTVAYGHNVEDTVGKKEAGKWTKWGKDDAPISDTPGKTSTWPRLPWMEQKLVVSNLKQHKAVDLRSSDTSWGPDFVDTDGMFCDMGTKPLTPLCLTKNVHGCIITDDETKSVTKRSLVAKRVVDITHKTYKAVNHWDRSG